MFLNIPMWQIKLKRKTIFIHWKDVEENKVQSFPSRLPATLQMTSWRHHQNCTLAGRNGIRITGTFWNFLPGNWHLKLANCLLSHASDTSILLIHWLKLQAKKEAKLIFLNNDRKVYECMYVYMYQIIIWLSALIYIQAFSKYSQHNKT